jgi:cytochrome c-type biogenesis protein CcmH
MILFWVLGAALAALVLALVLRPLLAARPGAAAQVSRKAANLAVYRDQLRELEAELAAGKIAPADHQRARRAQARLLEDVDAATVHGRTAPPGVARLAMAVPVCAFAVYLFVGSGCGGAARTQRDGEVQIEAMVERLAAKMRENPDDAEGWKMLGRSYAALGRFADRGRLPRPAERAAMRATPTPTRSP